MDIRTCVIVLMLWVPSTAWAAQQTFTGGMASGEPQLRETGFTTERTFLIDASAEKIALITQVCKTGTLDRFEVDLQTVTQAPTNGLRFSFQDVSLTTGDPDGTSDQYCVDSTGIAAGWFVPDNFLGSTGCGSGTKRSVTQGDFVALVVEFESFVAGDSIDFGAIDMDNLSAQWPYTDHFTAAWADSLDTIYVALRYDDSTYCPLGPFVFPATSIVEEQFANDDTPDERGLIFQIPFPADVCGADLFIETDADTDVVLYDSNGSTVLDAVTLDPEVREDTGPSYTRVLFDNAYSLTKDTNYRITVRPGTTTNSRLTVVTVNAAALLGGMAGGSNWHYTSQTDAGGFTETTTKRPLISPLLCSFDDAAGGGGRGGTLIGG